jgi:uncharacterized membrane protein YedE/YeeE
MAEFNEVTAVGGGMLIGLSATLLLALNGKIAGISGMVNGALRFQRSEIWRWWFLAGMLAGGGLYEYGLAPQPTPISIFSPWAMVIGGLLVGIGTRVGNGCTSGHGVCGLGRLSGRSLAAVLTFLFTGFLTVLIMRHGLDLF